jgi:hypothetical protein
MKKKLKPKGTEETSSLSPSDSDVTREERELLRKSDRPENDESKDLEKLILDKTGNERRVNEKGNPLDMGADLDIPGAELDDAEEAIGGEDEENNNYSRPD